MKKVLVIYFLISLMSIVYANTRISINDLNLNISKKIKSKNVTEQFSEKYKIEEINIYKNDEEKEAKWTELAKKTTFLILGPASNNELEYEYVSRKQEYYKLRYEPNSIPVDQAGNYITSSQEYKDDIISGLCIPQMFTKINSLEVEYDAISSVNIREIDGFINVKVLVKDVIYNVADEKNPRKIVRTQSDIIFNYLYKWNGNEYKLYYYTAMFDEDLEEYFEDFKDTENESKIMFESKMLKKDIEGYDLTNLYSLSDLEINGVYNDVQKSVLMLNAIYDKSSFYSANAFCIEKDYFVTTWNFIDKALLNAQYISAVDDFGNTYEIEGIVYANTGLDMAIIKVKDSVLEPIKIANPISITKNDPVIIVSSKTGYTLSVDAGLFIRQDDCITNLLTLSENDGGSPIIDKYGNCIGMNTVQLTNSDLSIALPIDKIFDVWKKINDLGIHTTISFAEMKEQKFYNESTVEESGGLDYRIYQEYCEIGNMKENLPLNLVKTGKAPNMISLRFENPVSDYIDTFAISSVFEAELIEQGYKIEFESDLKKVYRNNKKQVVLIKQFNYLVVIIVGK